MRSSSSLFFFRRGGDGLGVSRLVPSKDAGEAVPLIALVCSGTFLFVVVVVRVLAVSLSLYLFFFFFDVMNAFFDTTRREECLLPKCSRKGRGRGGVELPRDASLRLSVSVCISFFAVSLRRSRTKIKNTFFFCRFQSGVLVGATFMSRQILHSPGFYASREERKRGIDEPVQEKRVRGQKWYKHRVRRYFEERNKTKAPGELLPWLNAMFAPIHQPYDDVVGRKRT